MKAGTSGDQASFRRAVEALIAEERAKKHELLAEQLARHLARNGSGLPNGETRSSSPTSTYDLFFELTPNQQIDKLILPEVVTAAIRELVEEHNRRELLRSHNLNPRNRILLAGPPGNGKTSLAEALATALMVPFIVVRYEGLIASYLGETASRLRRLFDHVRTRSCVLFFDEFDTIGKERGDAHETGEIKRVVSSLLLQIDSLPTHVVVVTATNHPELLDRAVWRRFQIRLELPQPTRSQIERYFAAIETRLNFSLGITPKTLAEKLGGANFSELEDFAGDIARRYVLSLPDANVKRIVADCLSQWQLRFRPRRR
ncbi:MAG: AAA family ATPase [Pirellulales bacterium]|nr:AAA family ATPase [Pirellulales bacterium]